MFKKGENTLMRNVLIIVLVAAIIQIAGWYNFTAAISGEEQVEVTEAEKFCGIEDVSLVISSQKMDAAGTQPGVNHRLFVDGVDKGSKSEDASTSVGTFTDYVVYLGENSTNGYYTVKTEGNTDCKDPWNVNEDLPAVDTTITCYVKNDDGTLNSNYNLSIGTGESVTVTMYCKTTEKEFFGNPTIAGAKNVAIFSYNDTTLKAPVVIGAAKSAVPTWYDTSNWETNLSSIKQVAYEIPLLTDVEVPIQVTIAADSGANPGATTHGPGIVTLGASMNVTFADVDYDLDADTLDEIIGIEDEDGNDHMGTTYVQDLLININ